MSTSPSSKVDGLVSGLNTTAIINAIMAQAALPQTNLKNQLLTEQTKLAAYQTLNTDMASLQTAADALDDPTTWQAITVSSSSSSVVATATAGAQVGSFTFDVTQLASGQSSVSANTVSSTSAIVTTGSPVTLTVGTGSPVTIDTGDGSLSSVAAGINAAKAGVQAAVVQVAAGQYRLQLTSTATGSGTAFSVSGLDTGPLGAMNNTATAQDAQITVGAGTAGAYTVTSSSNTFSDVLPDTTFTVSELATGVTLTATPDSSGIATKVQAMVDSANSVLSAIANDTKFDTTNNTPSVLTGDYTAQELQDSILNSLSAALGDGTSVNSVGLDITKDGQITFDSSAFEAAFAADPVATQNAFTATGSFAPAQSGLTGTVSLQSGSDATEAGSYDVVVTQAATQATASIDTSSGLVAGQTITLGSGGASATYTVQTGDTAQSVVDAINAMAATNTLALTATLNADGTTVDLASTAYGSGATLTSSATGGLVASSVTAGLDVAGTIDGQTAHGLGQLLYTDPGTPGLDALTLNVTLTAADVASLTAGAAGTFTYSQGASQKLASAANTAVDTTTGTLTNEISSENTMIADLNTQISDWQVVLDAKQTALQAQWANLETQLSQLQGEGSSLTAAIGSLGTTSTSTSSSSSSSASAG